MNADEPLLTCSIGYVYFECWLLTDLYKDRTGNLMGMLPVGYLAGDFGQPLWPGYVK